MDFLMDREDPQKESRGCTGALCSRTGRRRWRDRRCSGAGDGCRSNSEDRGRQKRQVVMVSVRRTVGVGVNPSCELYWMARITYRGIGQLHVSDTLKQQTDAI